MTRLSFAFLLVGALARAAHAQAPTVRTLDAFPIAFERNAGQADREARFIARGSGYTLLLTDDGTILRMPGHRDIRVTLTGARTGAALAGEAALPGTVNYFIGHDPSQWHTDIPTYARARYAHVYAGIDLVYYGAKGRLEYDFVVAPGSDPGAIRMRFDGVEHLALGDDGDLALRVGDETLTIEKPTLYQEIGNERRSVAGRFRLLPGGEVGFSVGAYDHRRSLVIDPVLVYSTFVLSPWSGGQDVVVDVTGAAYFAGYKREPNWVVGLPPRDVVVAKLNASGSALLFTTYLGTLGDDAVTSIRLDGAGNIYLAGSTDSFDFPMVAAAQPSYGGNGDGFLVKLNAAGNAITYSTYLGGSDVDQASGLAADAAGNVYVAGTTRSPDFPLSSPAQSNLAGGDDAFVAKFDASGNRLLSTYLGGSAGDGARGLALSVAETIVVGGFTSSSNFPVTAGVDQPTRAGIQDGFVARLSTSDLSLMSSTFLGGGLDDGVEGVAVDGAGAVYVAGFTRSANFPVSASAAQPAPPGSGSDGFVTKLTADLTSRVYSTFLGGSSEDSSSRVVVDDAGRAIVGGSTLSTNIPTVTPLQPASMGSGGFIIKINEAGTAFVSSTYWAAPVAGLFLHSSGDIFLTGSGAVDTFPTTQDAFLKTVVEWGNPAAYVARISESTPACSYQVLPTQIALHPSTFFGHDITVIAPSGCAWTAVPSAPWIELQTTSGVGIGTVALRLTGSVTQTGSISIVDQIVTVALISPSACSNYGVSGLPVLPSEGGSVTATLVTSAGCPWVLSSPEPWVTVSPTSGVGSASITVTVAPYTGFNERSALVGIGTNLAVGGITVRQSGPCTTTLSSFNFGAPRSGGVGTVTATVSPPTCAWSVQSNVQWLTASVTGGVGSATLSFTAAPSSSPNGRIGVLMIAGKSFVVSQNPFLGGNTPAVLPPSPPAGSGASRTFTFTFYDANGAANLDVVNVLINNFLDGRFGCYLAYASPINVLYLVNDPGDALLPGLVLDGSNQSLGNGQCLIDGSGSSAVKTGNVLTLTLKIAFDTLLFPGNKVVYQAARDLDGNNSGWVQQGVWHVPGGTPGSPAVLSMTPARGGGLGYPFQFTYHDDDGYTDLVSTTVLLNSYLDGGGACYLGYHVPSNTLLLLNNAGNAYLPPLVLGTAGTVENSQCRIRGQGSGAVGNGTDLTLTLVIEFKTFVGERVFYVSAQDATTTSGWQAMGSWTVP